MSLQFILGNAGAGKSHYLYEHIISESVKHPEKNYILIVPEQFTLQTQKELMERHPRHSMINIEVLPFLRLAYRVFDELGTDTLKVLEDTGKNLVLRRVAYERRDELTVLKDKMQRPGYISEIKSLISELSEYNITPETFEKMMDAPGLSTAFKKRSKDILTIYKGFNEYIEGKYITSEDVLTLLSDVAEDSKIIRDAVIVCDGFTGFTPIQNNLIRTLLPLTEKFIVNVTIDVKEDLHSDDGIENLFYMSKKMVRSLEGLARDAGVNIDEPVYIKPEDPMRFKAGGELYFLEQHLFRPGKHMYEKEDTDEVEIICCKNPRTELIFVASRIRKMIISGKYRYRDFAVVCGDMELYKKDAEEIFADFDIPVFIDSSDSILLLPAVEFIRGALFTACADFSYESVMHFIKTGLLDIEREDTDKFENYLIASGVRGRTSYDHAFTVIPAGYTPDDMVGINNIRSAFMEKTAGFFDVMAKKDLTVSEACEALYGLLLKYEIEKKLDEKSKEYEEKNERVKATEYDRIYPLIIDFLEKMHSILGDDPVDGESFKDLLDAGLDAVKVGIIPPSYDQVVFGDMERTRLEHIRNLFFIGVNDGAVPKAEGSAGIITDAERVKLKQADFELSPTEQEKAFMQRFYLYLIMTKPSEHLCVSYLNSDRDGNAKRKSYFINLIRTMFPKAKTHYISEIPGEYMLLSRKGGMRYLSSLMQDYVKRYDVLSPEERKETEGLFAFYLSEKKEEADLIRKGAFYFHREDKVEKAVMDKLHGDEIRGSVSRITEYQKCAYAYYLDYELTLSEREEHSFESIDMGNLYHKTLELYGRGVSATEKGWKGISKEESMDILESAMREAVTTMPKAEFLSSAREKYILSRMRRTLERTVDILTEQVKAGDFIPEAFEVSLETMPFKLNDGKELNLRGKVDRLDACRTANTVLIKIIDYKTGANTLNLSDVYYGIELQLLLYMDRVLKETEKKDPGVKAAPAAALYYHVDDPITEVPQGIQEEEMEKYHEEAIKEILRGQGILSSDIERLRKMDNALSAGVKSLVIPAELKKDGDLTKATKAVDDNDFLCLARHIETIITETGNSISEGRIDPVPFREGNRSACTFCPYISICGFDEKIPGYKTRDLKKKSDEEVLNILRESYLTENNEEE
ncbi:MAG: PD-(D/E)XK nuclease family protein [Lachnospiraceae bacterium]|nr:PD-(D/E)XK nuclease family protein [Lachnospiraceae bacterium]